MKNLVEEWAKQFGYTVTDVTKQQGNMPIEWALEIKSSQTAIIIYAPKNSDLLRFQIQIDFAPEHQIKTGNLPNEEYNAFVLDMTDRLATLVSDWQFIHDQKNPKQMNALMMNYTITYDVADKNTVLQLITKSFVGMSQMVRALNITLNKGGNPQGTSTQSTGRSIYG